MSDKKVGRPCKGDIPFTTTIKDEIIKDLGYGMSIKTACTNNGISQDAFYEWRKNDASFAERVSKSIRSFHRLCCGKLMENIQRNDQRAIEFAMKTRIPDFVEKSEQKIELENKVSIFDELSAEKTDNSE